MTTIATKTINEEGFSKTEKEYKAIDKALSEKRKLFDSLKAMEALGLYGTEKWTETFNKYKIVFKKAHGYTPHWVR